MLVKHIDEGVSVPWIESVIEVEADIAEPSVVTTAVSLDVVFWPVVIAKEELCSHIVGKLINIEQPFHFFIDAFIIDALGQLTEMVECFIVAVVELIILKHVNFLIIVAIVRIHKLVVTGLTQVEDALEFSVDVFRHLHHRLYVEVDARTLYDGCQGRIGKTGVVVPHIVTAITYQQSLVSVERLLWEERIVEAVLPVEYLIRLEFHGTGIDVSCPSARNTDVDILVEEHTFGRTDITEVDRTVPRLIPVHGFITAFTGYAVATLYVNTPHGVGKVTLITHDRNNGNGIFVTCLYKATGDRNTGQITILEETENIISGP